MKFQIIFQIHSNGNNGNANKTQPQSYSTSYWTKLTPTMTPNAPTTTTTDHSVEYQPRYNYWNKMTPPTSTTSTTSTTTEAPADDQPRYYYWNKMSPTTTSTTTTTTETPVNSKPNYTSKRYEMMSNGRPDNQNYKHLLILPVMTYPKRPTTTSTTTTPSTTTSSTTTTPKPSVNAYHEMDYYSNYMKPKEFQDFSNLMPDTDYYNSPQNSPQSQDIEQQQQQMQIQFHPRNVPDYYQASNADQWYN